MKLCNIGHVEVCYSERYCPACAIREYLQEKNDNLMNECHNLLSECENLHKIINSEKREEDR